MSRLSLFGDDPPDDRPAEMGAAPSGRSWRRRLGRGLARIAVLALIGATALGLLVPIVVQHEVRARLSRIGRAGGMNVTLDSVRFSWAGTLRVSGLRIDRPDGRRAICRDVVARWTWGGGRDVRRHVEGVDIDGLELQAGGLALATRGTSRWAIEWRREGGAEDLLLREAAGGGDLRMRSSADEMSVQLSRLDLRRLMDGRWRDRPIVAEAGLWSGAARLLVEQGRVATVGSLAGEEVRLLSLADPPPGQARAVGAPTRLIFAWDTAGAGGALDVRRWLFAARGVEASGRGRMETTADGPLVELEVSANADLAAVVATTALELPEALHGLPRDDLGRATLELLLHGRPDDPRSVQVSSRMTFRRPPTRLAAFDPLRGAFVHEAVSEGVTRAIDVSEDSADYVPFDAIPPLLVRALTISEDAAFFGHPGIDAREVPIAWLTNRARGLPARGASTITQQLVKNLYLSREKSYDRKLKEAVVALLLDASLPKQRILEIYLNIIEWGPGLFGVGPAARHYFGKDVIELTPREIALLVILIPSPVRYHQAHLDGRLGAGLTRLVSIMLAKLHSVDAIDDDAYQAALAAQLTFAPEPGRAERPDIGVEDQLAAEEADPSVEEPLPGWAQGVEATSAPAGLPVPQGSPAPETERDQGLPGAPSTPLAR